MKGLLNMTWFLSPERLILKREVLEEESRPLVVKNLLSRESLKEIKRQSVVNGWEPILVRKERQALL